MRLLHFSLVAMHLSAAMAFPAGTDRDRNLRHHNTDVDSEPSDDVWWANGAEGLGILAAGGAAAVAIRNRFFPGSRGPAEGEEGVSPGTMNAVRMDQTRWSQPKKDWVDWCKVQKVVPPSPPRV